MLVLSRKQAESIKIGNDIVIKVLTTKRGVVKLGIEAPSNVRVLRAELTEFKTAPVAVASHAETSSETATAGPSDSMSEDECYDEFPCNYSIEVEDLMLCVGAH